MKNESGWKKKSKKEIEEIFQFCEEYKQQSVYRVASPNMVFRITRNRKGYSA
ncbi:MAG: hypothetical protein NTU69_08265 [Proteobacteria bacterium]|nr:hypothetical protein [Pseudomonadota bacterium]